MKKLLYVPVMAVFGLLLACSGNTEDKDLGIDALATDESLIDSTTVIDDSGYVNETLETENILEAKYGEQWEFCDCVVKNDSVNKVLEEAEDDTDYDAILARMDEIDLHCKIMLITPNTTPDERKSHERKVRKCLKNMR